MMPSHIHAILHRKAEGKLVYVDNAKVLKHGRGWFHLTADSLDELHAFAAKINISVRAFHRGARHPHYDITGAQRDRAIRGGASPVTAREVVFVARRAVDHTSTVSARSESLQLAFSF
ncbi:DUF4031 domain-containing protein [Achromobacter xylosoxidans]